MDPQPPSRAVGLRRSPVFILCPPRSCSTVVTLMLGGHSALFATPELRLFRTDRVGGLLRDAAGSAEGSAYRRVAGLLRALAQVHDGEQTEASIDAAHAWLRERAHWSGVAVMDHLQAELGDLTLVEKSPENTGRDSYLARFRGAYPAARFIHLVRHPSSSVTSLLHYWQPPGSWRMSAQQQPQFACAFWYLQHHRIERYLRPIAEEQKLRQVAEELLHDPRARLPTLLEWLDLPAAPGEIDAMLQTHASPFAGPGPANAIGGGDAGFFDSPMLRTTALPGDVGVPDYWELDPWTRLACMEAATRYGYQSVRS